MKPVLPPALCPDCGQPSVLVPRTAVFRRDTRQVTVEGWFWECPSNCPDEEGRRPARFSTPALMEWEEAQARLDRCPPRRP